MKKGFTLVELSIVMTIIGLLIGGIVAAQSMIRTAKTQSLIRQIQQIDIAVSNFQQKYSGLPGDVTSLNFTGSRGSATARNGIIEDSHANEFSYADYYDSEEANFFPQLQLSGFMQDKPAFSATISGTFKISGTGAQSPSFSLGKNTGIAILHYNGYVTIPGGGYPQGKHYYIIGDYSSVTAANNFVIGLMKPSIQNSDGAAIDAKIDDGLATASYDLYGNPTAGNTSKYVFDIVADGTCSNGIKYATSGSGLCALAIRMLATNYGDGP